MLKYGFFDSLNNDREYSSADVAFLNSLILSNGVYAQPATSLQVVAANDGMNVIVKAGTAVIGGRYCINDSDYIIGVYYAGGTYTRYTRIVLRLNLANRLFEIIRPWKDGAPPDIVRDSSYFDLCLATIAVQPTITVVTQAMITDDRGDNTLCGWLTGAVDQIDTTDLFAQYGAEWEVLKTQYRTVAEDPTVLENYALKAKVFEAGTSFGTTQVSNVNGIVKSGWYYALSSAPGVPSYNYYWFIHHIQGVDNQTAVQVAYARTTPNPIIYTRMRVNGTYTSWALTSPLVKETTLFNGAVTANAVLNLSANLASYTELVIKATSSTNYVSYQRIPKSILLDNGYILFDAYSGADAAALQIYGAASLKSTVALTNLTIEGWA